MKLLLGPYVGCFKNEIKDFRPYIKWIQQILNISNENTYISSIQTNRFLYDWIPYENFFPINNIQTLNSYNYRNENIDQHNFNKIVKSFKCFVLNKEKCYKKDLICYNVSYNKLRQKIPIQQKIFTPIQTFNNEINHITVIPTGINQYLLDLLSEYKELNILHDVDEVSNYKQITNKILESNYIICKTSIWTLLCNLHNKKVLSWGENIGQYKLNGNYNFNNQNCSIIPDLSDDIIFKQIKHFLNK